MSFYIPSLFLSSEMKHPVRRCLFERPTAEKQLKDFETQESRLEDEEKLFREKWGLDPKTGSIVSGAEYECVPVDTSNESIPSFYTKGYAPRKLRPVQSLRRERSVGLSILPIRLNFDCPNPLKRRYPSENERDDDHDENNESVYNGSEGNKRVPADGDVVITTTATSDSLTSSNSSSLLSSTRQDDGNCSKSLPMSSCFQIPRMVKTPSMSDISPRSTDLCTPQQRPRSLTQKTIKDYLPCKKPRCATKILPRT